MTITNADRNLAVLAQMRLDKLAACPGANPGYADEDIVCRGCGFLLLGYLKDGEQEWRHSPAEIAAMERIVAEG